MRSLACLLVLVPLAACGGGGDGGVALDVGNLLVQGKVVDETGRGVSNVGVVVDARGPFLTDATGRFDVPAVRAPYWVVVLVGASGSADVWTGLTRPDPILVVTDVVGTSAVQSTPFSGKVTGGVGFPLPPQHEAQVHYTDDVSFFLARTDVDPATGDYAEDPLQWAGPSPTDLEVHALQYQVDADGRAVQFEGYGVLSAVATSGLPYINQDVALGPVSTTTVSGAMQIPGSLGTVYRVPFLRAGPLATLLLPVDLVNNANFSLAYPVVPGLERGALFLAGNPNGASVGVVREDLAAPTTNLAVPMPEPTDLALPIDGAAGVGHDTLFRVTPSPGDRVFVATWQPDGGAGPTIRLVTTASSFRIPMLEDWGVYLPPGALYEWRVNGFGPATTVDDVAVLPTSVFVLSFRGGDGSFSTSSSEWNFFVGP